MGLASMLGYEFPRPRALHRAMRRFGGTRVGAWFFSKTLLRMDQWCRTLSKGRTSVPQLLAALPVVFLTTTGRRSGQRRTSPLVGIPHGDDLAVLGTNFGQEHPPAWALNLLAEPAASVEYRGVEVDVVARVAGDDEAGLIWRTAEQVTPAYLAYRGRITTRDVLVFVLEPT